MYINDAVFAVSVLNHGHRRFSVRFDLDGRLKQSACRTSCKYSSPEFLSVLTIEPGDEVEKRCSFDVMHTLSECKGSTLSRGWCFREYHSYVANVSFGQTDDVGKFIKGRVR